MLIGNYMDTMGNFIVDEKSGINVLRLTADDSFLMERREQHEIISV